MTPTGTLQVGPYTVTIALLYTGPLPDVQDGDARALAQLLNQAIQKHGLAEAIEQGREASNMITAVSPATEADDQSLRNEWAALTREELGPSEVARVGLTGSEDTLVVSWAALRKALAELRAMRENWQPEPGPWLFARPAKSPLPTPEDRVIVNELEKEATEIDKLDMDAGVADEPIELIERRRRFLKRCQDAGVFDQSYSHTRSNRLANLGANRLYQLRAAVLQLREWGLLKTDQEPLDGPVCLDYVRHELWPPDDDYNAGLRWAPAAIQQIASEPANDQGMIIESVGGVVTTVFWRRDGDQPALLGISDD